MTRFSLPVLVAKAVNGNKGWQPQWPDAEPKAEITTSSSSARAGTVSGTAYYLAKEHGVSQRGGHRQGVARRRQHRAQHHHHPLELPLRRECSPLRARHEAVGRPGARS